MGAQAAEQPIPDGQQRADRAPCQWRGPNSQAGCSPAPERGVQARHPAAIGESGMKGGLHLLDSEPQGLCVKPFVTDVNKQQSGRNGASAQETDFPSAERAFTVKVQCEWPRLFIVRVRASCIGFV